MCHEEAFQLVERQVTMNVKCCPRCARQIDSEQTEQSYDETLKNLSKAERRALTKERSHDWARNWAGKHVVITYDVDNGHGGITKKGCRIKGRASYGCLHEDVGYARVKVLLDEAEWKRIEMWPENRDTFNAGEPSKQEVAVVDGYRWGLGVNLISHEKWNPSKKYHDRHYDLPWALYVNWGDRDKLVLEEFDAAAELRASQLEEKRLQKIAEEEARRHFGEGI